MKSKERFEVLLEDIGGKVQAVLDGHVVLDAKIENLRQEMKEGFALADVKIGALNEKIDHVDANLSAKLDKVAQDLAEHRADTEVHHVRQVV